jgi:hypothetical protein
MKNYNWNAIAKDLVERIKKMQNVLDIQQEIILLDWHRNNYFESIRHIIPEYSKEIVLLAKTSNPIPLDFKIEEF